VTLIDWGGVGDLVGVSGVALGESAALSEKLEEKPLVYDSPHEIATVEISKSRQTLW